MKMRGRSNNRGVRLIIRAPPKALSSLEQAAQNADAAFDFLRNEDRGCAKLIGPLTKQAGPLIAEGKTIAATVDNSSKAVPFLGQAVLTDVIIEHRYPSGEGSRAGRSEPRKVYTLVYPKGNARAVASTPAQGSAPVNEYNKKKTNGRIHVRIRKQSHA